MNEKELAWSLVQSRAKFFSNAIVIRLRIDISVFHKFSFNSRHVSLSDVSASLIAGAATDLSASGTQLNDFWKLLLRKIKPTCNIFFSKTTNLEWHCSATSFP